MTLKNFLSEILKKANVDCFSYLLGNYFGYKIIKKCWLGEIYTQSQ